MKAFPLAFWSTLAFTVLLKVEMVVAQTDAVPSSGGNSDWVQTVIGIIAAIAALFVLFLIFRAILGFFKR